MLQGCEGMNVSEVINFHGLLRNELHHMLLTSHHADSQFCVSSGATRVRSLDRQLFSTMGKYVATYLQFGTLGL